MNFRFLGAGILGMLAASTTCWASINIEASVRPSRASIGEPLELTLVVTGAGSGLRAPQSIAHDAFRSYSQGHSEEVTYDSSGQPNSKSIFTYVLIPTEAGKHRIEPIAVEINGKLFRTASIDVDVVEPGYNASGPASPPGPGAVGPYTPAPSSLTNRSSARIVPPVDSTLPPEFQTAEEIFVKVWTDKDEVFVNQPVYATYTMYTRTSATFKGFADEPVTTGFWVEDFPPQGLVTKREKVMGRHRYIIADIRTMALFPSEPGNLEFKPGSLKVDVEIQKDDPFNGFYSRDIFGRRQYHPQAVTIEVQPRVLQTAAVPIRVKDFPKEGMPEGFFGAVGQFRLEASIDASEVEEGQAITYRLKLTGEGNLNTLELPRLSDVESFKSYDSANTLNLRKDRYRVEGEKILETVLVPTRAGAYEIPAIQFSFWDPSREKYEVLSTRPFGIKVRPAPGSKSQPPAGESAVALSTPQVPPQKAASTGSGTRPGKAARPKREGFPASDLEPLRVSPGPVRIPERPFYLRRWFAAAHLGALGLALAVMGVFLLTRGAVNPAAGAHRLARKRLREARALLKTGKEREFCEVLSRSIARYFAGKLRVDEGSVGSAFLETRLRGHWSDPEIESLKKLLLDLDYNRFSTAVLSVEELRKLYDEAGRLIADFERRRIKL